MLSRCARVFVVSLMVVAPVASLAEGPRIHRGPSCPKLFKERTTKVPVQRPTSASIPAQSQGTEMKADAPEPAEPDLKGDAPAEHPSYPANN